MRKDEKTFRLVIRLYQNGMKSLAVSIVGEKIADEVVQEAWLSMIAALPKFEGRSSLKTWILRIVANEAKTRLRKEQRSVSLEAMAMEFVGDTLKDMTMEARFSSSGEWISPPTQWQADSPEALLTSEELRICMQQLLTGLPYLQGATLTLKEQQGFSAQEICNILEVSESNIRVLLHRARNRLFVCVEHFQTTGECRTDWN